MSKIDDKLNEVLGIAEDVTYENEVKTETKKDLIVPEEKDPEIIYNKVYFVTFQNLDSY